MKLVLAISGGIAAYKTPRIVSFLVEAGHEVRVVSTANGLQFVSPLTLAAISGHPVRSEMFTGESGLGLEHIHLPEWADLILVAPATANLLAKVANGLADDLVSTLICAAGTGEDAACPVVFAPAMNTRMWRHAATQVNVQKILSWGGKIIEPESGRLACNVYGEGRMPEPETIVEHLYDWGLLSRAAREE